MFVKAKFVKTMFVKIMVFKTMLVKTMSFCQDHVIFSKIFFQFDPNYIKFDPTWYTFDPTCLKNVQINDIFIIVQNNSSKVIPRTLEVNSRGQKC